MTDIKIGSQFGIGSRLQMKIMRSVGTEGGIYGVLDANAAVVVTVIDDAIQVPTEDIVYLQYT